MSTVVAVAAEDRRFDLAVRCPRLARACRERAVELVAERDARRELRDLLRRARARVSHCEWLVAHRELQLIRAGWTGDGRYIGRRQAKLEQARAELAAAERTLRALS